MILLLGTMAFAGLISGQLFNEEGGGDSSGGTSGVGSAGFLAIPAVAKGGKLFSQGGAATSGESGIPGAGGLFGAGKDAVTPGAGGATQAGAWGAIGKSFLWAAGAALAIKFIAPMFGADRKQANVLALSIGTGVLTGKLLTSFAAKGAFTGKAAWLAKPGMAWGVGAGVAVVLILAFYPVEGKRVVEFKCEAWQPPTGGSKCEECNNIPGIDCSEYMCRSLGQACELLNPGSEEEKCAWVNPNDVEPPVLSTWNDPLLEGYRYSPDSAINPPDRGVRIIAPSTDECVPAFTPLEFGLQTNEPAVCKISTRRERNFDEMANYFGGDSLYLYNHSHLMALPGLDNAEQENITLQNDGQFDLFIKCQDRNGNSNEANFVFKYCVDKGPDTTPPIVVDTSIVNGMPVAVGQDSLALDLYINEPAECKWSTDDKDYENMENEMNCEDADSLSDAVEFNSRIVYTCRTTLQGIKDKQDNFFYFRCRDQPMLEGNRSGDRNTNAESYEMNIIGTEELVIDDAGPDGIVSDATEAVRVALTAETSAGHNEGEAICYYRDINSDEEDYVEFFETDSYIHSTDLFLGEEDYQYLIRCVDLGGNFDIWQVNFTVESDSDAPVVARAYKEENFLKITTSENASCVYDTVSCTYLFEDGIPMNSDADNENHFTGWTTKTKFYIKCRDEFGNQPPSDECSAIVRPIA